jgi:hypothetical protein
MVAKYLLKIITMEEELLLHLDPAPHSFVALDLLDVHNEAAFN